MTYHERVLAYEAQGMTTSDAQSVVDVENLKAVNHWDCDCSDDKIHWCRLHRAAPALLAALKFLLKQSAQLSKQITHDGLENRDAIAKARQAIAQAEGRP